MSRETHAEWKVVGLLLLGLYFLVGYRVSLTNLGVAAAPAGLPGLSGLTWLGRWRMFTELRDHHTRLRCEVEGPGGWTELDLGARYPMRWDEGPGYERDDFYRDPARLADLARDRCAEPGATAVRFSLVRWKKTLGSREQPERDPQVEALGSWPCP